MDVNINLLIKSSSKSMLTKYKPATGQCSALLQCLRMQSAFINEYKAHYTTAALGVTVSPNNKKRRKVKIGQKIGQKLD